LRGRDSLPVRIYRRNTLGRRADHRPRTDLSGAEVEIMMTMSAMKRRHWLALHGAALMGTLARGMCAGLGAAASSLSARAGGDAAPALLLARVAGPQVDVSQHLVSEKLDGVRAWWDGERLRFRSGAPLAAPHWFTAPLPRRALDGELWLARGRFDALSGLLRQEHGLDDPLWRSLSYQLFELPDAPGSFAQRVQALQALVTAADLPHLRLNEQRRLTDPAELQRWLAEVVAAGGEGLMLHRAGAPYVTGRSEVLLKLKPQADAEAVVLAHLPGKGRHAGRLGALQVRSEDGRVFALGSGLSDALRDAPPPLGSTVVYRYRGLTPRGQPRFATFWRVLDLP
jgi:DNA ligase-1